MSSITLIGTGNMARAIGTLAVAGGNTVEVMGRDQSKADDLAQALGGGATTGKWGAVPAGDIVITALLYAGVVPVVAECGDALAGGPTSSSPATMRRPRQTWRHSSRASGCARWTPAA
ncbi:NAD(P)-binding domain-containing protein [Promicromonospora sp. NPDC057138]|uniref:NAD(P)-binding domain-containing protein n=1 Tax=Promicromonospora sp. NPDC057138 TaxID=3346031 RepID=UPI00363CDFA0